MIVGSETPGKNIFDRMQELNVPNVSVAVISEGGVAWTREYDLASRTAHDSSSLHPGVKPAVFQAGSISKSINAVLAMKVLVESGLVELDEKLLYFPKTGVPNIFNGCDLHVMSLEYMSHCKMSDYKNSFIFLDQNTLFYVDNNSETHKVTLTDVEKLKQELNRVVDDQNPYTFHLTKQQVKEFITLNSDGEKFTLAQLLTHTAGTNVHGFSGYPSSIENSSLPTTEQILAGNPVLKALDDTDPDHPDQSDLVIPNSWPVAVVREPGEKYEYSGGGVTIIQKLIDDAIKPQTYAEAAQKLIFDKDKLDMTHSTFERQLPGKTELNIQKGHDKKGEVVKGDWRINPALAAGGLWTTAEDLAKFSVAVNDAFHGKENPLMSRKTAQAMLTLQPHSEDGLCFEIRGQGDSFRFSHAGSTCGYKTDYVVFPNQNVGAVILTNGNNGGQLIQEIQAALADEYSWPARMCERKTQVTLEESSARSVVGKFIVNVNDEDIELFPRVENGQLHLFAPLYGDERKDLILTPTSQREFVCVDPIYKVVFSEDYNCMTLDMLDNSLPRNTKRSDVLTAEQAPPISADVHPTTMLLTSRVSSGILGKQHTDPAPAFDQQPDKSPGIKPPGGSSD